MKQAKSEMSNINCFDFFGELPREITIDILSRLPIGSILRSKLASKACREAVKSREFADSHLSKHEHKHKHDTFFVYTTDAKLYEHKYDTFFICGKSSYKIFEIKEDEIISTTMCPGHALSEYKPLGHSSPVNGLILLICPHSQSLSICNPVTREYVRVAIPPPPPGYLSPLSMIVIDPTTSESMHVPVPPVECGDVNYGFGVSRETKQYKLVWIFRRHECLVYTLGTGQWRVGPSPPKICGQNKCASAGGKLYWMQDCNNVHYFDLETELFTSFSTLPQFQNHFYKRRLCVLEDCFCVCDYDDEDNILIWMMSGEEGDWSLEFMIHKDKDERGVNLPFKVLGDIILMGDIILKDPNIRTNQLCQDFGFLKKETIAFPFKPTFVSLKTLFQHQEIIHTF